MSVENEVNHDENTLRPHVEDALDTIDAAVFTGDSFTSPEALARLEHYIGRWQREMANRRKEIAD